jgi:hypothetical protein
MTIPSIGTCDDCGAELVPIWLTEYNWQCYLCKTDTELEGLRAQLAAAQQREARLRAALEEIARMCQSLIDETDIIDPAWVVQEARAAIAEGAEEDARAGHPV